MNAASEQMPGAVGIDNHQEPFSIWLDLFRWMAAFAVLLGHISHRIFLRPGGAAGLPHEKHSILYYPISAISSFAGPAVIIFFVLSGFLVGGGALRQYRRSGQFHFGDYMVARFTRLWVVLIPALLLTFALNMVGTRSMPGMGLGPYLAFGTEADWIRGNSLGTLVCNIAFLQTTACPQFGHNGALWSLFNEFWYYVAWPFVMLAIWSRAGLATRMGQIAIPIVGLSLLAWFQFVGSNIAVYFSIWLLGVAAADRANPFVRMPPWAAVAMMVLALLVWRAFAPKEVQGTNFWAEFPIDLLVALAFTNLVMVMKAMPRLRFPPFRRIHTLIAGFSFSLYCSHVPVINALVALLAWHRGVGLIAMPITVASLGLYVLAALLSLLVGYLLSLVTERHTPRIRRYLRIRLRTHAIA
jgi:peptidoglycan/LPS O-acetylase OafA/YrhL